MRKITLVTDFNKGTKKEFTSDFAKGSLAFRAFKIGKAFENMPQDTTPDVELFEELADVVTVSYNGQFTKEELLDGIDAPDLFEVLMEQLQSIFTKKEIADTTKDFLDKKNK
ncbi:phage tail assembly chaperone G [Macrococcus sp. EM39E]|uniref:phage tail assembly chaperone G n=1 Tax=Macrococcus animalis TaxID=3395467 RepID=UPI0039BE3492